MPRQLSANEYSLITSHGPRAEYVPSVLITALQGANVSATGSFTTVLFSADGYYDMAIGLTPNQNGVLTLLRYIDDAGTVALDAGTTQSYAANTSAVLIETDGKPFASYQVKFTNNNATLAATFSNVAVLTSAH